MKTSPAPAHGRPGRSVLSGPRVRLEPLDPARHAAGLFAAQAGDPTLWDYLPYGPFADVAALTEHLRAQAASEDPLFFAVVAFGVWFFAFAGSSLPT